MLIADRPSAAEFLPPGVVHYESGPRTTRMVERAGRLWAVTYLAEQTADGFWLVTSVEVDLAEPPGQELRPGDILDVRCKLLEDHGSDIYLKVEGTGYSQKFWAKRCAIAAIHRTVF